MVEDATSTAPTGSWAVGVQTAVVSAGGFAVNLLPGGLTLERLVDEVRHWSVPRLLYFLATDVCVTPLQGPELDILNTLVASVVMSVVRFVGDFRQRAEAAPVIPGSGGERNFVLLIQQLIE